MSIFNSLTILSNDFITEAAPLDAVEKEKVDKWQAPHHSFSDKAMGGADKHRVEIPLKPHDIIAPKRIIKALGDAGYKEVNYTKGLVKDKHGRDVKIGKALKNSGQLRIFNAYVHDERRYAAKHDEHKIVISRHPHDVAGMSTNQGWTSCMDMKGGTFHGDLYNDVKHGTHIAYLVHKDDHNLNHPIARIALKPFINQQGKKVLYPESKIYGTANSSFHKTVSAWTKKHFPTKDSVYMKHSQVYNDDNKSIIGNGFIAKNGNIKHYKNGKLHREEDKPAIEHISGGAEYYKNGKRHRDGDKPAVEYADGFKAYFKNGKQYTPKPT